MRRPSVAAESIAVSNLVDYALWLRAVVIELYFGIFAHDCIGSEEGLPLISPFQEASQDFEDAIGKEAVAIWVSPTKDRRTVFQVTDDTFHLSSHCQSCNNTGVVSFKTLRVGYENCMVSAHNKMIHCLILTDCSNLFSSVSNIAARCIDRCAKLRMAYIRDALSMASLSFVRGPLNISDVGGGIASKYCNL